MVAKFRQHLIEAQNLKPDSKERSAAIREVCTENLELVKRTYGETSLYCVRYMYTFFTATIGEEDDDDSIAPTLFSCDKRLLRDVVLLKLSLFIAI